MAMQSFFRRSSLWPFWQADLRIKTTLYYANLRRKQMGCRHGVAGAGADKFAQNYGTIVPSPRPFPRRTYAPRNSATMRQRTERRRSQIPESSAWWHRQAKELARP